MRETAVLAVGNNVHEGGTAGGMAADSGGRYRGTLMGSAVAAEQHRRGPRSSAAQRPSLLSSPHPTVSGVCV